jgi:hypothetical protein
MTAQNLRNVMLNRAALVVILPVLLPLLAVAVALAGLVYVWDSIVFRLRWVRWKVFKVPLPSLAPLPPKRRSGVGG